MVFEITMGEVVMSSILGFITMRYLTKGNRAKKELSPLDERHHAEKKLLISIDVHMKKLLKNVKDKPKIPIGTATTDECKKYEVSGHMVTFNASYINDLSFIKLSEIGLDIATKLKENYDEQSSRQDD